MLSKAGKENSGGGESAKVNLFEDNMEILSTVGGDPAFLNVRGKVAALTCGIQEETISLASVLVERGCRVVLIGSPISVVRESCRRVSEFGDLCTSDKLKSIPDSISIAGVVWDAARGEEQAVKKSVEEAWDSFGGINILINSESVSGTIKPALETSKEDYDNIMNANVKASWLLTTAVAKKMLVAGIGGSVIFLSSIAGTQRGIYPGVSIYGTSMAAINHLTKILLNEQLQLEANHHPALKISLRWCSSWVLKLIYI